MQFKIWLENMILPQDVLEMIKRSPNLSHLTPEQWNKWSERWGLQGEFKRTKLSALKLANLVDKSRRLRINTNMNQDTITDKQTTGKRNVVVITRLPSPISGFDYQVIDGNHTLVAAARQAMETGKDEQLEAIVPVDWDLT